jgi:four helix bundle protein
MKSHRDLDAWKVAIALAKAVYEVTRGFPKEEVYGMTSQMRRSAVSIASNIAEGAARQGTKEYVQYLYVAVGSASELDTQLEIAQGVGLGDAASLVKVQEEANRVTMILRGLIRALKSL